MIETLLVDRTESDGRSSLHAVDDSTDDPNGLRTQPIDIRALIAAQDREFRAAS